MYYLFILEDGEILRSDTFTDEDAYHCEFGTIDRDWETSQHDDS